MVARTDVNYSFPARYADHFSAKFGDRTVHLHAILGALEYYAETRTEHDAR